VTYYFGRSGESISVEDWVRLGADPHYRTVEKTVVGDYVVSTIWLGLTFDADPTRVPALFETVVIGGDIPWRRDHDSHRYFSESEARHGHEAMVLLLMATV
jgi:hypothetical protein